MGPARVRRHHRQRSIQNGRHLNRLMQRHPEPELMTDRCQVEAYAAADFSCGDRHTVALAKALLERWPKPEDVLTVVDFGCGPGNITLLLAEWLPKARVIGIDGSEEMLKEARRRASAQGLTVEFRCLPLQNGNPDQLSADLIVSNSLLHHLHDPSVLWSATQAFASPGCRVLHRDLRRPIDASAIDRLQELHLSDAPAVLVHDFRASLAAAFELEEVRSQLRRAGLNGLSVQEEEDRYLVVSGLVD